MPTSPHPSGPTGLPPSPTRGEGEGATAPSPLVGEGRSDAQPHGGVRGRRKTGRALLPADTTLRSRALRRAATEPEKKLWRALREAFPAARFRFQVPFDSGGAIPYHADFCSHGARLIVEVDGDTHAGTEVRDARRTAVLKAQGYEVVRFSNTDVMQNVAGLIDALAPHLESKA